MKKLIALTTTLTTLTGFAATSGNLSIEGTVDAELSIALDTSSFDTLDIINGGDHSVATATEVSNDTDGYKVYGYSANGSQLRRGGTSTTYQTGYTLKYDGASGVSLGEGSANRVELKDSGALTGLTTDTSSVVINVTAYADAPQGTYSDTITLEIEAN